MYSQTGIRKILLAQRQPTKTLADKLFVNKIRVRDKTKMNIKTDGVKNHLGQTTKTTAEITVEGLKAHDAGLALLKNLIADYAPYGGCLAQIVSERSTADNPGVFNLDGDNFFAGFEFEFVRSFKENYCSLNLGVKFPHALLTSFNSAALTNSDLYPDDPAFDLDSAIQPWLIRLQNPAGTDLFNMDEITDFTLKLSGKGTKNERTGRVKIHRIAISLEVTGSDASIAKMNAILGKKQDASVFIESMIEGEDSEIIEFTAGTLSRKEDFGIGDEERNSKLIYEAELPLGCFSFDFVTDPKGPKMTVKQ